MSEVRVNNIVDYGGKGAPTFDNGAVISGISSLGNQAKIGSNVTITSGGINVSGVTTAATLSGNLTGDVSAGFVTATSAVIGSGVTINAGGLNITGVMTATTFEGDGSTMTGVAMSISPLAYNPDVNDSVVYKTTGIGITFDHRLLAGSGNVTLSIATNAGAAGTTVENFGVGSSVTIQGRKAVINPTSNLTAGDTYHISYPSGAFTNTSGDVSYVGTAYTFGVVAESAQLWAWGWNNAGVLGQNNRTYYSSPKQIPGLTWANMSQNGGNQGYHSLAVRTDGTLWAWGANQVGELGLNSIKGWANGYSSPVQVPGTTWPKDPNTNHLTVSGNYGSGAIKTDGTLWMWGKNAEGQCAQNTSGPSNRISSPVQIPGTTWKSFDMSGNLSTATKTDGTLWTWGHNEEGGLGVPSVGTGDRSSPVQIPGTTWNHSAANPHSLAAIKTDGTLWAWGDSDSGNLGQNNLIKYSSPVQIPGTDWAVVRGGGNGLVATKTDGTLWAWGENETGELGQNNKTNYSSPVQIPGTTWSTNFKDLTLNYQSVGAIKTDGTLWTWGRNQYGQLGLENQVEYSSPKQVPGTDWNKIGGGVIHMLALRAIPDV